MLSLKEYREPTTRLPDYLPWAALIAPGVVLQKDSCLQKTLGFRGPDLASSSESELMSAVARLNNALKRLGSGWSLFVESQRFACSGYPSSEWGNRAAWLVDVERREQFSEAGAHFESSYYLTFVWQLPENRSKKLGGLFFDDPVKRDDVVDNERDLEFFVKSVREIMDIMSGVFVEVHELDDDETLTYLHSTVSTNRHRVKAPEVPMYLDALLPDQPLTNGDIPMLGDEFIPVCTFTGFPSTSLPGMLDDLNHLGIEYRWVCRYLCLDKADARRELEKYRKRWWQKRKSLFTLIKEEAAGQESALLDSDAANKAADADAALQELGEDMVSYGYLTCTVMVHHPDLDEALRRIRVVKQVVQSRGFAVKDETLNSREAWLGSLPGHVYANVRRPMVNSLNLAHMMPLSAIWAGSEGSAHLGKVCGRGTPHVLCSTTGSTPFRLNLFVGDVGHTLVVGPTGAGKSTLLGLLELQWLRYPHARVVIFDKDRSARAATMAVGGTYYEPGGERAPLAFQPLAGIDDPAERIWASGFVLLLLREQGVAESPALKKEVDMALGNLASGERDHRTMTVFCDLVQSREVRDALRPYTVAGGYGQLFDADDEQLEPGPWTMIEMNALMALPGEAVVPALYYLFHRVEQSFDGSPVLLVLDEAWLYLKHPVFLDRLQNWLKTLRKKNVAVVFATQEAADAADSPIMATIVSACQTKIFLPDEEALTPGMRSAYEVFGLSETEIGLLAGAQKKRDYYYRSPLGRRMFTLNMEAVALTFAAMSSPEDQRALDGIEAKVGPERYAEEMLCYRGLDWAAEMLRTAREDGQNILEA
ncbi:conjugal transfer protein TrbE [Prosthecochloris sp. ZM_2]|uniref:conjugal transfer protein TrbE n=1 Tax=Prosthecochloris sp. ZM_2 TaxID=2045206 RepID=UPI000DF7D822|nr:conjugal transfer protein TrbE [Prosthecochloris sp. ZM_2]RNA64500.1 conjugal transfer protein TrbE [Prosthecochloris sp. ZM_2]